MVSVSGRETEGGAPVPARHAPRGRRGHERRRIGVGQGTGEAFVGAFLHDRRVCTSYRRDRTLSTTCHLSSITFSPPLILMSHLTLIPWNPMRFVVSTSEALTRSSWCTRVSRMIQSYTPARAVLPSDGRRHHLASSAGGRATCSRRGVSLQGLHLLQDWGRAMRRLITRA